MAVRGPQQPQRQDLAARPQRQLRHHARWPAHPHPGLLLPADRQRRALDPPEPAGQLPQRRGEPGRTPTGSTTPPVKTRDKAREAYKAAGNTNYNAQSRTLDAKIDQAEMDKQRAILDGNEAGVINAINDGLVAMAQQNSLPTTSRESEGHQQEQGQRAREPPLYPDPIRGRHAPPFNPVGTIISQRLDGLGNYYEEVGLSPHIKKQFNVDGGKHEFEWAIPPERAGLPRRRRRWSRPCPGPRQDRREGGHRGRGRHRRGSESRPGQGRLRHQRGRQDRGQRDARSGPTPVRSSRSGRSSASTMAGSPRASYTVDGKTYITSGTGLPPQLEFNAAVKAGSADPDPSTTWLFTGGPTPGRPRSCRRRGQHHRLRPQGDGLRQLVRGGPGAGRPGGERLQ